MLFLNKLTAPIKKFAACMLLCIPMEEHATKEETKGQFVATSSIALEFLLFERWFGSALTYQFTLFFFYKSS